MKAVVLSAVPPEHAEWSTVAGLLDQQLARAGYDQIEHFDVARSKLGFCQGEFDCWLRHPGRCKIDDGEQAIVAAIPSADALVLLGPVQFGGWDHVLKRAIDRSICLITPFFEKRASLTHHEPRYDAYPRLYAVGLSSTWDPAEQLTFIRLNDANALNFFAPRCNATICCADQAQTWQSSLAALLAQDVVPGAAIGDRASLRRELYEAARADALPRRAGIKTAAVLVGSAKAKGTSASEHMAKALLRRLEAQGVACELHFATEFVHERFSAFAAAQALAKAELLVLATPLYVDALPALATHALELIARERSHEASPALFMPLINCGFPEPEHTRTAIRICRHFAAQAGYAFAGALPLGAGGMVTTDRSLDEPKPPLMHLVRALALAADALAAGQPLPEAALDEVLKPAMPDAVYRLAGDAGFRWQAHQLGTTQRELRATPLSPEPRD